MIRSGKALRRDDAHDRTGGLHREKRLQARGEKFGGLAGARSYPSRITTKHPTRPGLIIDSYYSLAHDRYPIRGPTIATATGAAPIAGLAVWQGTGATEHRAGPPSFL